jgi:uncharacterized protein
MMLEATRGTLRLAGQVAAFTLLVVAHAGSALATPAARELKWEQLIPVDPSSAPKSTPRGVVQHGQSLMPGPATPEARTLGSAARSVESGPPAPQPVGSEVVPELNGERVRMRGFVVPIGFDGVKVKEFLLVPYVGACIHVPPPPANQIVFIEAAKPIEISGMFEAVAVTGTLRTMSMSTELASVGYHLAADQVERESYK